MKATGAEIIIGILKNEGISTIAGIPGGSNLPLYDALGRSDIRHILARHEQGAGFMAQGMARSTGDVAVCFATSGPGATNLLTAIADAKLDSIPIVAITGQVPTGMLGTDAFQEIDTLGLSIPIVKHSVLIERAEELLEELPKAFRIARSGRPGPVLIDVPKDVQTQLVEFEAWPPAGQCDPLPSLAGKELALDEILALLAKSERPLVYAGAGCAASNASAMALRQFSASFGIPVVTTLMAFGAMSVGDPRWLGMLGMHGTRAANRAVSACDLLVAVGSRFDDRASGKLERFAPNARVIHIDLDPAEIGKLRQVLVGLESDAGQALTALYERSLRHPAASSAAERAGRQAWLETCTGDAAGECEVSCAEDDHPVAFLRELFEHFDEDTIVTTDVGQHQMWAAQAWAETAGPGVRRFLTSGGLGTMGFGLPTAIGAALANPDKRVLCVTGDGSLLMNIQELATLAELNLKVTVILMDNGQLGLVRQQQELFYGGRYTASLFGSRPDFAAIARGFNVEGINLEERILAGEESSAVLEDALSNEGPVFVRVNANALANVYPMVPPGGANDDAIGSYCVREPGGSSCCEESGEAEEAAG